MRARRTTAAPLGVLLALSDTLRAGLSPAAADAIARTAQRVLDCDSAVVTEHRPSGQTVAPAGNGGGRDVEQLSAWPIVVSGTQVATLHIPPAHSLRGAAAGDYVQLVGRFLELAELDTTRAHAALAEQRALRAEMSPHFLHNALTAISGFIATDPDRAEDLLSTFAEFLRASFRPQTDISTVADEIRLVESYLRLELARFGDRFEVSLRVAPETLGVPMPFLSLQPVVENAIRHGLERRPGPGRLDIVLADRGPEIEVTVDDDGVGTDPDALSRALAGVDGTRHLGVLAVDKRLRAAYGPAHGLEIATGPGAGTCVTMRLPKHVQGRG